MLKRIQKLLSSFSIKLFLWFWFVAIVAIVTSHFISIQFNSEVLIKPIYQEDIKPLRIISRHIKRDQPESPSAVIKRISNKKRYLNAWLKSVTDGTVYAPIKLKNKKIITRYLNEHEITTPTSFIFSHQRLTGPSLVVINQQKYQLFISLENRKPHFRGVLEKVPAWVRISITLLISFGLCLLLARSLSNPISIIKQVAQQLGNGDFSVRVQKIDQRSDELGSLAASFNQMADKLEQNVCAQQRLLGDVSHELRSPLTRLQMALGLAQQTPIDQQTLSKYLQRCELEVTRLDNMIADVLALSRLENSAQNLQFDKFNFTQLLKTIIDDAQFIADEKQITINLVTNAKNAIHENKVPSFIITADSQLLASAISNIVNNAVKYSDEKSAITLELTAQAEQLHLNIIDNGQGVPEQAIAQLFEPFYRVHKARDRKTGGTGLGLAIAKQAIIAHHGEVFAKNNPNKGLTVSIKLPINTQTLDK